MYQKKWIAQKLTFIAIVGLLLLALAKLCGAQTMPNVILSEIAWAGTTDTYDEWFELYNNGDTQATLIGWQLVLDKDNGTTTTIDIPDVTVGGFAYALLERTDDTATSQMADGIFTGGIANSGILTVTLTDGSGYVSDQIVMPDGEWPAGDNATHASMQWLGGAWVTSNAPMHPLVVDVNGYPIIGTPADQNWIAVNPPTCGIAPVAWEFDLDLIMFEDLSTTAIVTIDMDLLGANNGTLVPANGNATLRWTYGSVNAWELDDLDVDPDASYECEVAASNLVNASVNVLNGTASNWPGNAPLGWDEDAAWLNGVRQFQGSAVHTTYIPMVAME